MTIETWLKRWVPDPVRRVARKGFETAWIWVHRSRMAVWRSELQTILEHHSDRRDVILFLPTVAWRFALFQRPHQLARAFARAGWLVFYMELPFRNPRRTGFEPVREGLYIARVPLQVMRIVPRPVAYTVTYNPGYLRYLSRPRILYDYMDELEVFRPYPLRRLVRQHRWLLTHATVVMATAHRLLAHVRSYRPDARYVPNGVDYAFFRSARMARTSPPPDLQPIVDRGTPIVGYYGALAEWFDYDLMTAVARRLPEWSFVLIGPEYDASLWRSRIRDLPNVHYLGPRPYDRIPAYVRWMDIMTIPFRLNAVTHATSPLKLFEYMAAHKPIVITPMEEACRYPGVLVAGDADTFVHQLQTALRLRRDRAYIETLDRTARANTWDMRVHTIIAALTSAGDHGDDRVHTDPARAG